MLKWILLFAITVSAGPSIDSLKIAQLEGQLRQIEIDKERDQREADREKIQGIETMVRNLARQQSRIDNNALWGAGDKIQSSIWMSLAAGGCLALAQAGASNNNAGLALIGFGGFVTFDIISIIRLYDAGNKLKSASNP